MTVTADLAISLDGYMAGPDDFLDNPGGDGVALSEWIHNQFWGDNPPFRTPVFVLTHRLRPGT
ncbi:hypothetical protein [Streptomyces venetus]|uniref:hypothetical protein n=1 Tax=Streptomyces venetus TaxID=1701086 RepID=UPI003C2FAA85